METEFKLGGSIAGDRLLWITLFTQFLIIEAEDETKQQELLLKDGQPFGVGIRLGRRGTQVVG